ncbi:MAG: hypothetical protein L6N94_00835 [Candidatus Methylarchaceae archaeon HK01M]|nr:hypothetical protein [Candidatus Methylarchaceae archaeon HK01M]
MGFTEEEVKRAAELRLWIEERIAELEGEIEKLREALAIMDNILRVTSFKVASELAPKPSVQAEPVAIVAEKLKPSEPEVKEVQPIKRSKDGYLMGNVYVSDSKMVIAPASDARLEVSIPPFESFFINRILEGMKNKDEESLSKGKIEAEDMIRYAIEEENGVIKKITVENYRDKRRLNEIINTVIWTFTRMLEKTE